ncbi:MAG: aminotransferase class III-fold pyridoxal phosphate-dependent enzyme [Polynucleobacter sp.]|jgi:4-aminobutyrate--pyruvate transaminase|nr:aminotransferase class III-fold pyridoxal phosphate-dependent enzyme [Polynucleobacter sp.]
MSTNDSLPTRDALAVVHGLTNLSAHAQRGASVMQSGKGVWVQDIHGRDYIEAMSGLWCIALGYGNERLADVAHRQMMELAYYPLTNHKSHPRVIELAEKLLSMAPVPMSRIWFASTGSEAIDCAARLSWYFWNALGQPEKKKFISHQLAYHGNTIASASLSGVRYAHEKFNLPLPGFLHVSTPHFSRHAHPGETEDNYSDRLIADIEKLIYEEGAHTIAAFFVEPVMAAGGIVIPPARYYEQLQILLKKHDILLVCDEVVTAFGRTGKMFGSTTMQLQPDLLVCAKALSSAYIPISALMICSRVYEAIERQSGELGLFGLTMTYSGHPVASAVALETLKIYEELHIVDHVQQVGPGLVSGLMNLRSHSLVKEVRGIGLLAGVELAPNYGAKCARIAEEEGLIVRAIGDTIAFCPPLIISELEVQELLKRFTNALNRL